MNKTYVPAKGPINPKLMIIGEAPSYLEVERGEPFVGPSGKELDRLCSDSGVRRSECWISNVSKYEVPLLDHKAGFRQRCEAAGVDYDKCLEELQIEINEVNPNCILALGGTALTTITGKHKIKNYRGSILFGMGHKCISTYHPAHLLHQKGEVTGYWQRQIMIFDFQRAWKEKEFKEINRPLRNLHIIKSSDQLYNFLERHKNDTKLSVDIEAIHCVPICIGLAFDAYEGISVPLWNDLGFVRISDISTADLSVIWHTIANLFSNERIKKIGQNFKYDQDKLRRLGFVLDKLHSDTMLKAFCINPELPKNLAFNTSIYTEEPYYKDEGQEFNYTKDDISIELLYNARDAVVTWEIDAAMDKDIDELNLRSFYENFLLPLHALYLEIENEGLRVDASKSEELLQKYVSWNERISYELFKLTGIEVNVNSPKQVAQLLFSTLRLPERKGVGEEEVTQLLTHCRNEEQRKVCELVLEGRRVRKTVSNYILAPHDYDGRQRTSYFLCNNTGRTSTGQLEPPTRPMVDTIDWFNYKKKKVAIGQAFQTMTKHGDIGADVRLQYIADEGEIFIQADSSQAEARVVFLLADDEQALKDMDEHDYHALTASWFFGGSEHDYSKRVLGYESPKRFAGKTLRHAGHLGAKKRRASIEINTQARKYHINYTITEAQASAALNIFHARQPNIQKVFHAGIVQALSKNSRMLVAPLPYGIDSETGGKRIFYERWGDELFRQAYSYLPQRAITDNTKAAALRIKARAPWIRILLEAHDALLFSVPIIRQQEAVPIIVEEMERPISFANCSLPRRHLIIPCEIETGFNYKELSKFQHELVRNTTEMPLGSRNTEKLLVVGSTGDSISSSKG